MNKAYQGSCLCGAITFEVEHIGQQMAHCHCSMCRKFHGAAFATYGEALSQNFRWLSGEQLLKTYLAENGTQRQFCENCGSSLRFIPSNDEGKYIEFSLAAIDGDVACRPDAHIYTSSGANWYQINDGLPRFTEHRGSQRSSNNMKKG